MKSFYNEYWAATSEDAAELRDIVDGTLVPIFNRFMDRGYNAREIAHLIQGAISNHEAEVTLRRAMAMRKQEKALDKVRSDMV